MNTFWTGEGNIVIEEDGQLLLMSREEAEQLFVDLGHVLQDMDVEYWKDKTGDGTEQPEINKGA